MGKLHQITMPFDSGNVEKWIRRLEIKMTTDGVTSQWYKQVVLEANLPPKIVDELESLFSKVQSEFGANQINKELKTMLLGQSRRTTSQRPKPWSSPQVRHPLTQPSGWCS